MMATALKHSDDNIVHIPYDVNIDMNRALSEYCLDILTKNKNKIGQTDSRTGKSETFGELLNRSLSLAQALKSKGVTTDDIVAFCCYNNMDFIVTILASIFIGARFSALDISAPSHTIHCLKLISPSIMFCEQEHEDLMESIIKEAGMICEIITYDTTCKFISVNNFEKRYKCEEEFQIDTTRKMKDTGCIAFTSGTSGLSKGVEISNFGLYYAGVIGLRMIPEAESSMCFNVPYSISNISYIMISIVGGIKRIIIRSFDVNTIVKIIHDYKINHTFFTQYAMNHFIKNPQVCQYDTSCLKYVFCGGSKIGHNLVSEIRKLFPSTKFLNAMGMTELCGLVFIAKEELIFDTNENYSVGTPIPGAFYKVVDMSTEEALGPNSKGELRIKYDGLCNGYLHQSDFTTEALDNNGFFKTGDIVYYDENINFYLVDRLIEIFKYKGTYISPVVIEDVLSLHPDVKESAIIPVPHEHDGELPMAVIILNENAKATEQDFIQYIKERLSDEYQLRGGVRFVDSLPRTTTGKLKRKYLKDLLLNQN